MIKGILKSAIFLTGSEEIPNGEKISLNFPRNKNKEEQKEYPRKDLQEGMEEDKEKVETGNAESDNRGNTNKRSYKEKVRYS